MKKQDLTNDEQMVLSYLVLIDAYVKRNNTSDEEEEEDSLCDRFVQVFDGMGVNGEDKQQRLFYDNLISLNEKKYIDFEDGTYALDDDMHYEFNSLKISEKGEDYARKYMELDTEELKIAMRKTPKFSLSDIADVCKQINNNELFKLVTTLATALGTVIK